MKASVNSYPDLGKLVLDFGLWQIHVSPPHTCRDWTFSHSGFFSLWQWKPPTPPQLCILLSLLCVTATRQCFSRSRNARFKSLVRHLQVTDLSWCLKVSHLEDLWPSESLFPVHWDFSPVRCWGFTIMTVRLSALWQLNSLQKRPR